VLQALTDARGAALGQNEGLSLESKENSAVLTASPADLPERLDQLAARYFQQWRVKDLPVRIDIVAGNGQTAITGTVIDEPIELRVVDFHGDSVVGAVVYFAPARGSGAIGGSRTTTDAQGKALARDWRLGKPGENQLVATVVGSGRGALSVTLRATSITSAAESATSKGQRPGTLTKTPAARPGD
jgi:hypothetical protein